MTVKKTFLFCAALFCVAILLIMLIFNTEPEASREGATKRGPMLVQTQTVTQGTYTPHIRAMGIVTATEQLQLKAQVAGQIATISPQFKPGAQVKQGEMLALIDDADFQLQIQQSESALVQAKAALDIEMGERAVAEKEYQRLGQQLNAMQKSLVLREPQRASAQASFDAAKAQLAQAELNLKRTVIEAPFNAKILKRLTSTGALVNSSTELATLVATDTFWIEASVPSSALAYFDATNNNSQLNVKIIDNNSWPDDVFRMARISSFIGELTSDTRLAKVLLEVPDPLALNDASQPALLIGSFVECLIPSKTLEQVVRVERQYIRKNDTAWVMVDGALSIRSLNIVFEDDKYAYIREGLKTGDALVMTDLARVREGAPLRLQESQ